MTILDMEMLCGRGNERGVELVMDEWRDEKEGNEWAQEPIGRQSKTKMARSTVPQGIMVTRMDTNLFSSC